MAANELLHNKYSLPPNDFPRNRRGEQYSFDEALLPALVDHRDPYYSWLMANGEEEIAFGFMLYHINLNRGDLPFTYTEGLPGLNREYYEEKKRKILANLEWQQKAAVLGASNQTLLGSLRERIRDLSLHSSEGIRTATQLIEETNQEIFGSFDPEELNRRYEFFLDFHPTYYHRFQATLSQAQAA